MSDLPDWAVELLKDSPTLVVCLLIIWYAFGYITKQHERHLADKDKEIERLVAEKNELQKLFLQNRLSTAQKDDPPKIGRKKS